jgi:hypothetical protein
MMLDTIVVVSALDHGCTPSLWGEGAAVSATRTFSDPSTPTSTPQGVKPIAVIALQRRRNSVGRNRQFDFDMGNATSIETTADHFAAGESGFSGFNRRLARLSFKPTRFAGKFLYSQHINVYLTRCKIAPRREQQE